MKDFKVKIEINLGSQTITLNEVDARKMYAILRVLMGESEKQIQYVPVYYPAVTYPPIWIDAVPRWVTGTYINTITDESV